MNAKDKAIEIAESLKGLKTSDNVIENVEKVCEYVLEGIYSITGSARWQMSQNEIETLDFWKEVKKEAKNLNF